MTRCSYRLMATLVAAFISTTALTAPAHAETITGDYCQVQYTGIEPAYAQAFADIYDTAHEGFKDLLSLPLPKHMTIKIQAGQHATQLWTDGEGFIYLNLESTADLHPNSGYFHIYGICQQMGLISLYSSLSTLDGLPDGVGGGWGHYCGSLVVDYVWDKLGASAWPVPWDYSHDGMSRLTSQCANAGDDPTQVAACTFLAIGEKYGHKKVGSAMKGALGVEPAGNELMGRFAKILDARTEAGASEMIPGSVRKSKIIPKGDLIILPSHSANASTAWTNEQGFTGYDDDAEDGMRSLAGGGHAVKFTIEGGGELTTVSLKGGRYGYPQSESSFLLVVIDGGLDIRQVITLPYMKFAKRGEPLYWVDFELTGVEVTEEFYVLFDFSPEATDGVYVGYDANSTGHSYTGNDASGLQTFRDGDWMIRVKVE